MQLLESGLGNERAKLGPGLHGCMGARGLDGYYMVHVNPQDVFKQRGYFDWGYQF